MSEAAGKSMQPTPDEVATTAQRWIYRGIRVPDGKRVHAWIDPDGDELLYAHKRADHWAIGSLYTAHVERAGDVTRLHGSPHYTGDGTATGKVRRQLWAKDTAAKARLARPGAATPRGTGGVPRPMTLAELRRRASAKP